MTRRKVGRPCTKCRIGLHYGSGFCEGCEDTASTDRWAQHHQGRTTTERGYGHEWEQTKKIIKIRDKNLCQPCKREGVVTQATSVDHILAKAHGGSDEHSNLECICDPHHKTKTAKERTKRR